MLLVSEPARRYLVQRLGLGAALCRFADEAQEAGDQEGDPPNLRTMSLESQAMGAARRKWPHSAKLALAASLVLCGCTLAVLLMNPGQRTS